jgi:hypothetical protein
MMMTMGYFSLISVIADISRRDLPLKAAQIMPKRRVTCGKESAVQRRGFLLE